MAKDTKQSWFESADITPTLVAPTLVALGATASLAISACASQHSPPATSEPPAESTQPAHELPPAEPAPAEPAPAPVEPAPDPAEPQSDPEQSVPEAPSPVQPAPLGEPAPPAESQPQGSIAPAPAQEVTERELRAFSACYIELVALKHEVGKPADDPATRASQEREFQEGAVAIIERSPLTQERYAEIVRLAASNPNLRDRIRRAVEAEAGS